MKKSSVVIIGAGLSGLSLAYNLEKKGLSAILLEARDRLGGRILTSGKEGEAPIEMGATWLGKKHASLIALLDELGIDISEQHMGKLAFYEPISTGPPQLVRLPDNEEPSFRIVGGSSVLIERLADRLNKSRIYLNEPVRSVELNGRSLNVHTEKRILEAGIVASTLPPRLLASSISFTPALPPFLLEVARNTHTWMGDSIKIGISYSRAFWTKPGTSGTLFSNVGPMPEMYDHSSVIDNTSFFALKGFMTEAYHAISREKRKQRVLNQLVRLYGRQATDFLSYREKVWRNEAYTFAEYKDPVIPHQHNGDPVFKKAYLDGKFIIAGAETAGEYPGYMEGAVRSAKNVSEKIISEVNGHHL